MSTLLYFQLLKAIKVKKMKSITSKLQFIRDNNTKVVNIKADKVSKIQSERFDSTREHNRKIHLIGLEICSARRKMAEAKRMKEEEINRYDDEEENVKVEAEKNLEDLRNQEEM